MNLYDLALKMFLALLYRTHLSNGEIESVREYLSYYREETK